MTELSVNRLKEVLEYNPETGIFVRKLGRRKGCIAGHIDDTTGKIIIYVDGEYHYAHSLAWFYMYGIWKRLDHKDNIGTHNQISNLREATSQQNNQNQCIRYDNMLGIKGVTQVGRKFRARIFVDGVPIHLGMYLTLGEAANARRLAEKTYFGEFAPQD